MANDIIAGDYLNYTICDLGENIILQNNVPKWMKPDNLIKLDRTTVQGVELVSEENQDTYYGTGWGLDEPVFVEPLSVLLHPPSGEQYKDVLVACHLRDGSKFLAFVDPKIFWRLFIYSI